MISKKLNLIELFLCWQDHAIADRSREAGIIFLATLSYYFLLYLAQVCSKIPQQVYLCNFYHELYRNVIFTMFIARKEQNPAFAAQRDRRTSE